MTTPYIQRA